MKISVDELRNLPQQRLMLTFNEKLDGTEAVKPTMGEIALSYSATGIKVSGRVKTLLKLQCDRCLRPYFQTLNVDIEERFVPPAFLGEERDVKERELLRDDFVEPLPADGLLDITDVVYQAVTLATPSYCLCGEECPGPPNSAADQATGAVKGGAARQQEAEAPIDPRWKNLKSLFPKKDSPQNS